MGVVLKFDSLAGRHWKGYRMDQGTLDEERFNVWVPDFACSSTGFEFRFQQHNFFALSNENRTRDVKFVLYSYKDVIECGPRKFYYMKCQPKRGARYGDGHG